MAISTTWVRDNYDANKNRYIDQNEFHKAEEEHHGGEITEAQLDAVLAAYQNHTLLPTYSSPTTTVAKGKIVNFNYPSSSTVGERIAIRAGVQNIGTSSGTFKLQLFMGYTRVAQSTSFSVASGQTSSSKSLYINTPSSGLSVAYKLKCVRIT